ncbi:MAG: hypothetical protein J6Y81_12025 [Ruminococcus sp.]|nr:hypothetical protein [Ruminococcus sp.]
MSYCKSAVSYTMHCLNERLCRWARHKFKRFRGHKIRAKTWLQELAKCSHIGLSVGKHNGNTKNRVK